MRKLLITGGGGRLASALEVELRDDFQLFLFNKESLDVTDKDKIIKIIKDIKPDIVIHTAAFTDVDACQIDKERAYRVNSQGVQNVVLATQGISACIVYISTDYVFNGDKREPYTELDEPGPINEYGRSKLLGEFFVKNLTDKFFIIRTAWLFGRGSKPNFVKKILELAKEKEYLKVVDDQVGSPTYTKYLARKIKKLIIQEHLPFGLYHITNGGSCSWYELAEEVLRLASIKKKIYPIKLDSLARPAKRPKYSVLDSVILPFVLGSREEVQDWRLALEEYLKEEFSV